VSGLTSTWLASVRARHSLPSHRLLEQLPDIGNGLAQRLRALERAPDLALIDELIRDSAGLPPFLMRLREAMVQEAAAGGAAGA
jgi:hypothetical protein